MPRLPRINVEGAIYYVTSKPIQNEVIFKDKEDYKMYLDLIKKYKSQHKFKLYSYCLLPDRLELLLETGGDASISDIMHDINSLYTKYFNGRYQKRGHLFEARFRSVLVEKIQYLAAMTRHVHRAPPSPRDYPYSSFLLYIQNAGPSSPSEISDEISEVLRFLRTKDESASYEKYVLEGDSREIQALEKNLRRGQILGSETFEQTVRDRAQKHTEELKQAASGAKPNPVLLFFIGGLVVLATASSIYLYVSKANVQTRYTELLQEKEREFSERTRFENISPIALTELDGTSWRLDLISLPADKAKAAVADTVHFSEGRFHSEYWTARGFGPVHYSVLVRPGGLTTWEGVQKNPAGDTLSWRGDWHGDAMKGLIRYTPAGQAPRAFSFFSAGWAYAEVRDDAA